MEPNAWLQSAHLYLLIEHMLRKTGEEDTSKRKYCPNISQSPTTHTIFAYARQREGD